MAGLLVSVRSVPEALAAYQAGAQVIDVKEPAQGPLGRASDAVIRAVRESLPNSAPVSVALGELTEVEGLSDPATTPWPGISWRKIGFSGLGHDPRWPGRWARLRAAWGPGPGWIGVIYADWQAAGSPDPDTILDQAIGAGCQGLLVDTWTKGRPSPLVADAAWVERLNRARQAGLMIVLAGGLDEQRFQELAPLRPDLFAVRGAACRLGVRDSEVDAERVRLLVDAAQSIGKTG